MPRIVISYRRSDSSAIAGRIFDRLVDRYGEDSVFMDVDHIPFGIDFRAHIQDVLRQTDILLAVIGPNWLGRNADGVVRMEEKADPVRVEIETALARQTPIIPVLVDGAKMPDSTELPPELAHFAYLNAAEVATGRDFRAHMQRLIDAIDRPATPGGVAGSAGWTGHRAQFQAPGAPGGAQWLADGLRYLLAPLVLLLVVHHLIVNVFNLETTYLWIACTLLPLAFGVGLYWFAGRGAGVAGVFAVALGLIGAAAMTVSQSLSSGDPVMPQTRFEWIDNAQFAIAIALSFFAGYLLAGAVRATVRRRSAR